MDDELQKLISDYQPTEKTVELVKSVPKIFVVGISGAGKNTIIDQLLTNSNYHFIISHVTRKPRENNGVMEKDGKEFHFIDMNKAIGMLKDKEFVEAKWVHRQNVYGTSVAEFKKCYQENKTAIADINVEGVDEYMRIAPDNTTSIFVLPPDFSTWEKRFKARYEGHVGRGDFQARLHSAAQEIEHVLSKHYYAIIINDNIDDAVTQIQAIANGEPQSEFAWQHGSRVAHELLQAIRSSTR